MAKKLDLSLLSPGWFSDEDAQRLFDAAVSAPPGAFLEIGVYRGRSAGVLQQADPDRELWLFDNCADCGVTPRTWPKGDNVHKFYRALTDADLNDIGHIALLHHDGDHRCEAVTRDLQQIGPHIVTGGFIVLHDWGQANHDNDCGVEPGWLAWPGRADYEEVFTYREQAAFRKIR